MRLRFAIPLLPLLLGCHAAPSARPQAPSPSADASAPRDVDLVAEARAVIDEVIAIRGLPERHPIELEALDDDAFAAAVRSLHERHAAKLREHGVKDDGGPAPAPSTYLGFYDEMRQKIVVRRRVPRWVPEEGADPRETLAHEVTHALQDQSFGIGRLVDETDPERQMALRALLEGDAELVRIAYALRRKHQPWKRALYNASRYAATTQTEDRKGRFSPSVLAGPVNLRERLVFFYDFGTRFASALYRAGGFDLLNRAFAEPPSLTKHIYHPETYLAGQEETPLAAPPAMPGYKAEGEVPFGELSAALLLVGCLSESEARSAVHGWSGGKLVTYTSPGKPAVVLTLTTWETQDDVTRAEATFRKCFPRNEVHRAGALVAVTSGLSSQASTDLAEKIAGGLPGPSALSPPLGFHALVPPPMAPENRPEAYGSVDGRVFTSRWLNIRAEIPQGFAGAVKKGTQLAVYRHAPAFAFGSFQVVSAANTSQEFHDGFMTGMIGRSKKRIKIGKGAVTTPLGTGTEARWRIEYNEKPTLARTIIVPACGGDAAYVFAMLAQDDEAPQAFDAWLASFRSVGPASSTACADIHREKTEDLP